MLYNLLMNINYSIRKFIFAAFFRVIISAINASYIRLMYLIFLNANCLNIVSSSQIQYLNQLIFNLELFIFPILFFRACILYLFIIPI